MPGKELLPQKRAQIVSLRDLGWSYAAISSQIGAPKSTIQSIILRSIKHNDSQLFTSRKRSGRPRVTSRQTDRAIKRAAVINPRVTASGIKASIAGIPRPPSVRTIQRRLQTESSLKCCRPAQKPQLSAKNIRDWLSFAKAHSHWTVEDWRKVQFSDDTTISQFSCYSQHVRRPSGQRYNPRYVTTAVKNPDLGEYRCFRAWWFMVPSRERNHESQQLLTATEG